ncbi:hypothetical protein TanjilG_22752 [Lupinus angustifolius]|uniref:Succinate dehydrogenase assembly factor 4, mitochondrial n=1 Tax=Lupinus angustifolius TaxID=3871 RepID=A0A4P1RHF3_LUPAN|nr:PREDICTED: succinate dehydrogenase assembly factor 4, mitochondrial [Lupinus angustifolius]OIW10945.1 hypothetical protein TanjilG_22752 [Lupinus angustifolius]
MTTSLSRLAYNPILHRTVSQPLTRSISNSVTRLFSTQHDDNPDTEHARESSLHNESKQGHQQEEDNDDGDEDSGEHVNNETGEIGGPKGPEPTRYGDWEQKGRCSDF